MNKIKITDNQYAAIAEYVNADAVTLTKTTVSFTGTNPLADLDAALAKTAGRGYPRQPLMSVRRKLIAALTTAPVRPAAEPKAEQPAAAKRPARVKTQAWKVVGSKSGVFVASVTSPKGTKSGAEHNALKLPKVREFACRAHESWVVVPA